MTVERVRLGSVVSFARKSISPEKMIHDTDYILLEHIRTGTGEVNPVRTGDVDIRSAKLSYSAGDVLYGKLRPKLRKVCVGASDGYCSTDIVPLSPLFSNTSHYIAAALRSDGFLSEVERLVGGANLPRVNTRELLDLEIPWIGETDRTKFNELARFGLELRSEVAGFVNLIDQFESSLWSA